MSMEEIEDLNISNNISNLKSCLTQIINNGLDKHIFTMPIWGYTGVGKTTMLVTLNRFLDNLQHAIELGLLNNADELQALQEKHKIYKDLNFQSVALSTRNKISNLDAEFCLDLEWPNGTDKGSALLFSLDAIKETVGYLYMPDLPGGSYEEASPETRELMKNAHGCIILVDTLRYNSNSLTYCKDVHRQIRFCVQMNIPSVVLMTKCDRIDLQDAKDKTWMKLRALEGQMETDLLCVRMVSIMGLEHKLEEDDKPLSVDSRDASSLIEPFLWLVEKILSVEDENYHQKQIPLQLNKIKKVTEAQPRVLIPEIRSSGTYTVNGLNGLFCGEDDEVMYSTNDNTLVKMLFDDDYVRTEDACLIDDERTSGMQIHFERGICFAGHEEVNYIYRGLLGDDLSKEDLGDYLKSWLVFNLDTIIGIDQHSRLIYLNHSGSQWNRVAYIADFISKDTKYEIFKLNDESIFVSNTQEAYGVEINSNGFGGKFKMASFPECTHDTYGNNIGFFVCFCDDEDENEAYIVYKNATHPISMAISKWVAVSKTMPYIAWVDSTLCLNVIGIKDDKVFKTRIPGQLTSNPLAINWSNSSKYIYILQEGNIISKWSMAGI